MRTKIYIPILIFIFAGVFATYAKTTDPETYISQYSSSISQSGQTSRSFDYALKAYREYYPIVENSNSSYSDVRLAVSGLKWAMPILMDGAFFHSENNNQSQALQFAEAYVDSYTNSLMKKEGVATNELYPTLAYFAASNNYNKRDYAKAIRYLDAYINSGDPKNVKDALNYMAKAYINVGQPEDAKKVLVAGLEVYPSDLQMLTTIINLLAENKSDDSSLQKYVSRALQYRPNEIGLLNIQAQLLERTGDFSGAAEYYKKLKSFKPNNLDIARHLGINLYNSGVQILNSGGSKSSAHKKLQEAAVVLNDVVVSDPLAINYAYALANVYSILGDNKNLEKMNSRITSLGQSPVSAKSMPELIAINNEHIAPSSIPATPTVRNDVQAYNNSNKPKVDAEVEKRVEIADNKKNKEKTVATAISDVDCDIPSTGKKNLNTFVVIIANNEYQKVSEVKNADNDGKIFSEYCNRVLGIPQDHIRSYYNVTYGELLDAIEDIKSIAMAKRGDLDIIFYYAGHGIPDESNKTAHLLPVDADGRQLRICYPLSELYSELDSVNANRTLVFLDACFSGANRSDGDMLLSARGVAIAVDPDEVKGNLLVFSAASGSQTALSYDEQNHGMFTYFLLKKLKESKGNVELGALADYLTENVALESQLKNRKQQVPTITAGRGLKQSNWQKAKLIK